MKKVFFIITINILVAGGQLVLATGRSADGVSVSVLNSRFNALREENERLAQQIYTKSSLVYVASQAAELGLATGAVGWVNGQVSIAAAR